MMTTGDPVCSDSTGSTPDRCRRSSPWVWALTVYTCIALRTHFSTGWSTGRKGSITPPRRGGQPPSTLVLVGWDYTPTGPRGLY